MDKWSVFSVTVFSIVIVTYGVLLWFLLKIYIEDIRKRKSRFFDALLNGFQSGIIKNLEDVTNIYRGVFKVGSENYRFDLNNLLREFLVKLLAKDFGQSIDAEILGSWKMVLLEIISRNEELSPFSELPDAERNIMRDITAFIEQQDFTSLKRKLTELAGIIQARKEHVDKIEKSNKWSIPLAVIGLVLTIIFGLLSIR